MICKKKYIAIIIAGLLVLNGCQANSEEDYLRTTTIEDTQNVKDIALDDNKLQMSIWEADDMERDDINIEYDIDAHLDESLKVLTSDVTITYTNKTSDSLASFQVLFPMKALAMQPYSGFDIFDGTVKRDNFNPISFEVDSVKINGQESNYEWTGNHKDVMTINLLKPLNQDERIDVEILYSFSLPESGLLGYEGGRYSFNEWYPLVPFYNNGEWQGDYHENTWYYHVPYAIVNVRLRLDEPRTFISYYDVEKINVEDSTIVIENVIDRSISFYLMNDIEIHVQKNHNFEITYVYPGSDVLSIDLNRIEKYLNNYEYDFASPKKNNLIVFLSRDSIIDESEHMVSYDVATQSIDEIQKHLVDKVLTNETYPIFINSNEESAPILAVLSFYRSLHIFSKINGIGFDDFSQKYLESKINFTQLKQYSKSEILKLTEDEFKVNFAYRSAMLLVDLEKMYGQDKVVAFMNLVEEKNRFKGITVEAYLDLINAYFGEKSDTITSKYYN